MSETNQNRAFKEAVCIDAMRVFDSCSSQDCLEDLTLTFDTVSQAAINEAQYIKCKCIQVTGTSFVIDPVPFNRGFYTVDVTYTFRAEIEAYGSAAEPPAVVYGTVTADKTVILFGSDGSTQRFMSNSTAVPSTPAPVSGCAACCDNGTLPVAGVSIAPPMCLDADLVTGGTPEAPANTVTVTVGVFAIIELMRPVPILIPAYDYGVPESDCPTESDTPCELFAKIQFPTAEFFPQGLEASESSCGKCGTGTEKKE
ncbi:MAG: hypothetical protein IKP95_01380 [Ruminococcus sp.]|nr:hypothetical protein [Ruminococcus sp.]